MQHHLHTQLALRCSGASGCMYGQAGLTEEMRTSGMARQPDFSPQSSVFKTGARTPPAAWSLARQPDIVWD